MLLPALRTRRPDVVGVNVTFTSQLPFALHLCRLLRNALPGAHLVVGGTEVSDVYKYLADKRDFFTVFADADSAVVGEGETAFAGLLDVLSGVDGAAAMPSVRFNPARHPGPRPLPVALHNENLRALPSPSFDDVDFGRYLSPHRYVYLSPTRGCCWNRCAFCDYGLNGDAPTSPWRQEPADQAFAELERATTIASFVYLSVDVLAPVMLHRLAERVRETGLDVQWGAEVRLERYWTPENCRALRAGGCVAVSVGFESASQRVLDAMDKGTRIEHMRAVIENLAAAGIAVQIMAFSGFPGETYDEAMLTVDFLDETRDLWTLGDIGEFALTAGSLVAKDPARYGLTSTGPAPGDDIHRSLVFTDPARPGDEQQTELRRRKRAIRVADLERPWLGGVDTPHSYFYHGRYSRDVGALIRRGRHPARLAEHQAWRLNGKLVRPPDGTDLTSGHGITLRRADTSRLFLMRRDGAVFLCPPDLPAATADESTVDPAVDVAALTEHTRRALLANRLIMPSPTTQEGSQ